MKTVAAGSNASGHAQKGRKNTANKHVCRSVGFRLLTEVLAALLTLPLDHCVTYFGVDSAMKINL